MVILFEVFYWVLGNYAFVEFRTPDEATNGFALNNVQIFEQVGHILIIFSFKLFFAFFLETRK